MELTFLLDAPAKPVSRIQIAKLGTYSDSRYGDFDITADNVASWQKSLSKLPGGEALIDFEHRSERKPRDSKAAGWISGIDLEGDKVMADARWTPDGKTAIENEAYRFLSPVFGPTQVEGETLDDALPSVALTNKPFLASMPAVCLASDERVSEAVNDELVRLLEMQNGDFEATLDLSEKQIALLMLDVPQSKRDRAHAAGNSLPDKSYPIENTHDLHNAAVLAASGHGDVQAAKALIRKRAKELGVDVTTLPGFGGKTLEVHMRADAKALNQAVMNAADSRPPMDTETVTINPDLVKLLDLGEDADEAKILEAVTALQEKANKPSKKERVKTLEAEAAEKGLVLLDEKAVEKLQLDAAAGADAKRELHEQRFAKTFDEAVAARKVVPAERDDLHRTYLLDSELALKLIENRQPIMPDRPLGRPAIELDLNEPNDPNEVAAAGLHPSQHEFNRAITKYMLENKIPRKDYVKVMDDLQAGRIVL